MTLTKETKQYLSACVDRGAKRLDQRKPKWYTNIVAKDLDLSMACNCVIGQVYGEYDPNFIRRVVGWVTRDVYKSAATHGFNLPERQVMEKLQKIEDLYGIEYRKVHTEAFKYLDRRWLDKIKERRAADRVA